MIDLLKRAKQYGDREAIRDHVNSYSYKDLLEHSQLLASLILHHEKYLAGAPIAMIMPAGFSYVAVQWAIWQTGSIAVPLNPDHPLPYLRLVLQDTGCKLMLVDPLFKKQAKELAGELRVSLIDSDASEFPVYQPVAFSNEDKALILYTSGTTGIPKGVVLTHANLQTQMEILSQSWGWSHHDVILNVLPLHHVHGIVNVVCCALWNGAICEFLEKFNEETVFQRFCTGRINVFMAVPTIYYKLLQYWKKQDAATRTALSKVLKTFRLMVSGSAALPEDTLRSWQQISGHTLLERYGMTEIGMALSNPYSGTRHAGYVGFPLPNVQVKLMHEGSETRPGEPGEIWVQGPSVFCEYWGKPQITAESFQEGWFKTGDLAVSETCGYRILGRNSVDIIKSGGYKISALEIENILLTHPHVQECAVIGLPDQQYGELVVAAVVTDNPIPGLRELQDLVASHLPNYKKPRKIFYMDQLPRNVMGKLMKPRLKEQLLQDHSRDDLRDQIS